MFHYARSRARGRVSVFPDKMEAVPGVPWIAPTATYVICTNPRSGSWLLSEGLTSTSLAGKPREWFNILEEQQHRARWRMDTSTDLSFAKYLNIARAESTTSNGISGIKLHFYQLAELPRKMDAFGSLHDLAAPNLMTALFPRAKYVWLTRRDKVRQAISFVLAARTGEWWSMDGAATPNTGEGRNTDPEYDPYAIARREQALVENDSKWRCYFEENHIAPLIIYYEDLVSDYPGTIRSVLKWLGVPNANAVPVPPPRLKRQSNARNEEWIVRYEAFKCGGGNLEQGPAFHETDDALREPIRKPLESIPAAWKQWIAYSKLRNDTDDAIVDVLTRAGYSRTSALAEVRTATSDPYVIGAARAQRQLGKAASLLNTQGRLARLNSEAKVVERRSKLSIDEFRDRYYAANRPVIVEGLMTDWRPMTLWKPDYLKHIAGEQLIEIMTGRDADPFYELNDMRHRTEVRFADYIDMVYSGKATNDYCMVANNAFFQRAGTQPLLKDLTALPEYLDLTITAQQCSLWFGPAGTVTPLHHDKRNVLWAQIRGRRLYRLIPASQWQYVYNRVGIFSDVDCGRPDLNSYPKFRLATVIDVVLEPGEVLFTPVGWWYYVRALDVSMTVSFTNFLFPNHFTWE
ncbi:Stf0 family sulfotransferase [Paraburkholderia sp. J7]|uniref:Stf0 family sulfotransferase n=1 Tax=Paraburkholderia sp. J7 TaxID=2805438 RepID=UPI002AB66AF8|nr:Stf0 family sulfotransferase [Paraburkholderia sp. J7]